ncbi:TPA: multi-ligand-binding adhesin PfbA [Streptococcus pneumoniae]|uniref:multi-ligand-binding adhesin PfbA n=2 Tax=Streptococcus pneumoniae TaxID=1313 RepID=UPI000990F119|nr:multi-ligand-binding adhesin PfbA [Streptococcus pneumoniae]MBW5006458.1 multi-ligand-binding adhesin PfbA [Streptococcus pneumoniae]MDG7079635.1 multi-ligand-binding adhesin PfbA [Streptococcus pneumoniae]MDG7083562.1 multi-ligand-binding adhesin PfbA [Streptococcus pneumoniae]MDG7579014.1 multi-ligand-binding adhesin PfbA [Streptococcus pneumoniae]MDG8941494.1 multi-ligand-binding adhesin PfbA [Streptococcus pneumoniae]
MLKIVKKLEVLMKYFVPNEVFSIRKLKVGTCSVLLAISILGSQGILSDEVVTSSSPMATKESSNAITNDLDNSPTVNQNRSAEMIASNSTTNGLDNSLSVNSISSNGTIRSNSQLDNRTVESTVTSTNENKSYKEDVISDRIIKKEFEDTALSVKDYGAVGDGIHDDRQAIQDAIDAAAQGLGGGNVYFPEGTYLVKEIVFLKSYTHLELNEKATILNGINIKNHPSIVFMTGLFTDDGAQVEWGPTEDISYSGGTIDMNGALNEEGTKAKNLPLINSSGAFAIGNSNNVTIKNVTFKDSYQGHAIQIAGSKNVLVDNSRFLGQALPKTMKDGQIISKESIQIEPLTRKGFPYALNDDGKKSENVTIQNSYFGKSDKSGELVTAIGTHYQTLSTQNPSNIKILNNHFDNMMYAGVRFTGFTDVLIKGNRFDKKVKGESVHYRENGAALVNAYSYKNTKDLLDLNKQVVIAENIFNIADPKTKAIRVAKDSAEYLGKVSDITVTKNVVNNNSKETEQPNIELLRVSDNLVVSENSIFGGKEGIVIEDSKGKITVLNNQFYNLSGKYISFIKSNANGKEPVIRDSDGNFNIVTENGLYKIVTNNLSDKNEKEKNKEEKQSNSNNVIDSNQKNGEFNSSKDNRQMNDKIDNKQDNKIEEVNYKIVGDGRETENHINKSKEIVDVKQKLPKTGSNKIMELFLTVTGIGLLLTLKGLKYYGKDK